jgi:membrane-bound lytic murein transglycosylase D
MLSAALMSVCPGTASAAPAGSSLFPVPEIIKPNVAFWIRIYTEVSLQEGLLHDRDYPQVVYEKIPNGDRTGKKLSEFIDQRRKIYVDAIIAVRDSAPAKWGAAEKRVAELFKSAPEGALTGAEERIRHQGGQRERFKLGLARSAMYLDTISAILKKHGVPDELKYLPHVESSFDAEAYSKVGAAGLWQFMRSTGKLYMKIDYMFDERSDPIISTNAAAKFLKANYDMLGAWPLAITAYNHGPNGIRGAVEKLGTRDIAVILQKHESASFRFASKNFYSCFVAVLQIVEKPEKYFKDIKYYPKYSATGLKLPFAMKPDALCKALGITESDFKALNPSLRPVVFSQKKTIPAGYNINVPSNISAEAAVAAVNRTPQPMRATPKEAAESEAEGYYTIVSGDNLQGIAKRLGVPMSELAAVNNITNSSKIQVGQVLLIPSGSSGTWGATVTASKPAAPKAAAATPVDTVTLAATIPAKPTPKTVATDTAKTVSVNTAKTKPVDTVKTVAINTASAVPTVPVKNVPVDTKGAASTVSAKTAQADTAKKVSAAVDTTKTVSAPVPVKPAVQPMLRDFRITVKPPSFERTAPPAAPVSTQPVAPAPPTVSTAPVASTPPTISTPPDTSTPVLPVPPPVSIPPAASAQPVPTPSTIDTAVLKSTAKPAKINPDVKPDADPTFNADVYDLGMTVAPGGSSVRVRVSVDETIGRFAEWMRVNANDIRAANDMAEGATLPLGTFISIPIKSSTNIKRFEVNRLQYHLAIEEDFFARFNVTDFEQRVVKPGVNLWRICSEAQIPMWLLKKYNRGVNFYALQPGNTIWIPKIGAKDAAASTGNELDPAVSEAEDAERQ